MNTPHPYDLVIGLDRSDHKADLCLIDTATGQRRSAKPSTPPPRPSGNGCWNCASNIPRPASASAWNNPPSISSPSSEAYDWITLYPINPITLQKYREAFVTSRAKDDAKDADYLADLLLTHHAKLKPWAPEDSATRAVQQLVFHRRAVVDERTGLTNRLIALLKQYFPQALVLCGEDLWRPLATRFLLKWPSLQAVQKAKPATLKAVLLSQRLPQRQAAGTTPGPGRQGRAGHRRNGVDRELRPAGAVDLPPAPTGANRPSPATTNRSPRPMRRIPTGRSLPACPGPDRCWGRGCWPAWVRNANASARRPICSSTPASRR